MGCSFSIQPRYSGDALRFCSNIAKWFIYVFIGEHAEFHWKVCEFEKVLFSIFNKLKCTPNQYTKSCKDESILQTSNWYSVKLVDFRGQNCIEDS